MNAFLFFIVSILSITIDQASKYYVRSVNTAQLNTGGVFGLAPGQHWNYIVIILLSGLTIYVATRLKSFTKWQTVAFGLILSSGFSNALDRIIFSGVWDWIVYPYFNVVGNIADIFLGFGVCLILFEEYLLPRKDIK